MTSRVFSLITVFILCGQLLSAQVKDIKAASSSRRFEVGGGSSEAGGFIVDFLFQFMFGEMIYQQQRKLEQKRQIPSIISLDLLVQCAAQPSSYYIINPRIRGNWGLFSTDFRFNYILEEDIDGVQYLRTNDWQILQLNLVTTRDVTVRIGGGVLNEAYGTRQSYPEWTTAVDVRPFNSKLGGVFEYRGCEARREVNGYLRYSLFDKGKLHSYVTVGAVFQRHYDQVNVWGFQGGIALSVF